MFKFDAEEKYVLYKDDEGLMSTWILYAPRQTARWVENDQYELVEFSLDSGDYIHYNYTGDYIYKSSSVNVENGYFEYKKYTDPVKEETDLQPSNSEIKSMLQEIREQNVILMEALTKLQAQS